MFTSDSIRQTSFAKGGLGGYKTGDVNAFIEDVARDFERLENTNAELIEKMQVLAEYIEAFKEKEESIKTSLVNAQVTADNITKKADFDAKDTTDKATAAAENMMKEAQEKVNSLFYDAKIQVEEYVNKSIEKANNIVAEAESKAIVLRNDADKKVEIQKKVYDKLKKEVSKFRETEIYKFKKQMEMLYFISDSEKYLDNVIANDTTDEKFAAKIASGGEQTIPEDIADGISIDLPEIDEISALDAAEVDENQDSLFGYLS